MPDVIAVGVLVKPIDALNVTVDFRRIQYSQLTSDMGAGFVATSTADDYVIDDGNEIRAAGEYLFTNLPSPLSAIAIRGGFWHDPDHRIRYKARSRADTVLFPPGDSEIHYTGGGGIVFEKVQFDVGFDRSETVKTFSVSAVCASSRARSSTTKAGRRLPAFRVRRSAAGQQLQDARRDEALIRRQRARRRLGQRVVLARLRRRAPAARSAARAAPGRRGCWPGTGRCAAT